MISAGCGENVGGVILGEPRLIRWAGDFVILADRRWNVEAADHLVRSILSDIGLGVSEAKSRIRSCERLDKWIVMRLRSKARKRFKSKGGVDNARWPNRSFDALGLVRLERLAQARRYSPV